MIGMDMGLNDPLHLKILSLNISDNSVSVFVADSPSRVVNIHDRVNYGTSATQQIAYNVADRVGDRIKKALHNGLNGHVYRELDHQNIAPVSAASILLPTNHHCPAIRISGKKWL